MHYHVRTGSGQLLNGLPPSVRVFLVTGVEVLGVQIVYSVLAKLLGFEDIVYEVRRERAHTGRAGR